MAEENKSVNDLYREVIELQKAWREENKSLLADNQIAIGTLNSLQENFKIKNRIIVAFVIAILIVSMSFLVYTGKVKLCKVEFGQLALTTDNCLLQND